jgi:hypothetical protein
MKNATVNYLIIYVCGLLLLCFCKQTKEKITNEIILADSTKIEAIQPTDSILLLKHLDSLPRINFPFLSDFYNRSFPTVIDLSTFKNHKLFNLPFTRIPRGTDVGSIDEDVKDTTFNLTDNNYKAEWNLIAKTPKFVVLEVHSDYVFLVTLTYDLKLIEAIRTGYADPAGNVHWHTDRHAIINKDLTIILQHYSEVQVADHNYDKQITEEKWFIDKEGHVKQK